MKKITQSIQDVIDYILHSEMEGQENKQDSWYTIYVLLKELKDKVEDEEQLLNNDS